MNIIWLNYFSNNSRYDIIIAIDTINIVSFFVRRTILMKLKSEEIKFILSYIDKLTNDIKYHLDFEIHMFA